MLALDASAHYRYSSRQFRSRARLVGHRVPAICSRPDGCDIRLWTHGPVIHGSAARSRLAARLETRHGTTAITQPADQQPHLAHTIVEGSALSIQARVASRADITHNQSLSDIELMR
jgi:hypothetical protein